MNPTTYAVDTAKSVFQLHWVDAETGEIGRKKLTRAKFIEFFAQLKPARVVLEACAGSHHWARLLGGLGHQVELLAPKHTRCFVTGNKDDAADARALWLASQHSDIHRVPVKSKEQQAMQALHRTRAFWVKTRTACINSLRGLLYEFGVVLPKGPEAALKKLAEQRPVVDEQLPELLVRMLDEELRALRELQHNVLMMEAEMRQLQRSVPQAKRLSAIPGIGPVNSTALAATLGDGSAWRSGRGFAASLGLCPSHSGTGGKVRMGGISKRGDTYLRTTLISGARAVVHSAHRPPWVIKLLERRPVNVVVVAVANKLARTAWALIARNCDYNDKCPAAAAAAAAE
jgi:transposase